MGKYYDYLNAEPSISELEALEDDLLIQRLKLEQKANKGEIRVPRRLWNNLVNNYLYLLQDIPNKPISASDSLIEEFFKFNRYKYLKDWKNLEYKPERSQVDTQAREKAIK